MATRSRAGKIEMSALAYTLIPVSAAALGAGVAAIRRPSAAWRSAIQHFAAGVVFAAAAGEVLPDVLHGKSPIATLVGGAFGVATMLAVKAVEERAKGLFAILVAVGIDIFIDGLVLGLAFIGGAKAGLLLTIGLTLEILFLGLTVTEALSKTLTSKLRVAIATVAIALLLPVGTVVAAPVSLLSPVVISGCLSFGLMALLYLVTEELLVEAHETADNAWITGAFFVGFLALLALEEVMG